MAETEALALTECFLSGLLLRLSCLLLLFSLLTLYSPINARSYDWPVIIRAVNTIDAMTATIEQIEWPILLKITDRILAEVPGVNRVCYDLSPKPSATIEWE